MINQKIVQQTAKIYKKKILNKMSRKWDCLIIDLEFIDFN